MIPGSTASRRLVLQDADTLTFLMDGNQPRENVMGIDMNETQLTAEIDRARADADADVGLSVNRSVENGLATWEVVFGMTTMMTAWSSEDERDTPTADIAAELIAGWDAEWDD